MRSIRSLLAASLLATVLLGCSGDDGGGVTASTDRSDSSEAPLVSMGIDEDLPSGRVDVPSEAGATPIAEYSQGSSGYESPAPEELAQILSLVGVEAPGYITDDAVVVEASEADAAMWCRTHRDLGPDTYTLIPVLPDGTGVDCG